MTHTVNNQKIEFTKDELKTLVATKKELLTDRNATPSSYSACLDRIAKIAAKYGVDSQDIYNLIP